MQLNVAIIFIVHFGSHCAAGPKPSDLYEKFTWKIDKFSQINERELRSNAFEVGGYKWYGLYQFAFCHAVHKDPNQHYYQKS